MPQLSLRTRLLRWRRSKLLPWQGPVRHLEAAQHRGRQGVYGPLAGRAKGYGGLISPRFITESQHSYLRSHTSAEVGEVLGLPNAEIPRERATVLRKQGIPATTQPIRLMSRMGTTASLRYLG